MCSLPASAGRTNWMIPQKSTHFQPEWSAPVRPTAEPLPDPPKLWLRLHHFNLNLASRSALTSEKASRTDFLALSTFLSESRVLFTSLYVWSPSGICRLNHPRPYPHLRSHQSCLFTLEVVTASTSTLRIFSFDFNFEV